MLSSYGKLTCATCWKKKIPCVFMLYGSVEKSMDKAKMSFKEVQSCQQFFFCQLIEVQMEVQRHEKEVEFTRK